MATKKQSRSDRIETPLGKLAEAMAEIKAVQEEYEEWQGNLPENMQSGETASKLECVTSIDIDSHTDLDLSNIGDLEDISNTLAECEDADLPKGFGRD